MLMSRVGAAACAALITVAVVASAQAQPPITVLVDPNSEMRTAHVSYDGLDLKSEAGWSEISTRIRRAARQVCEPTEFRRLGEFVESRACFVRAKTDGMSQAQAVLDGRVDIAQAGSIAITAK